MTNLWGGRFSGDMDEIVKYYNASIFFDQKMYSEEIDGSIAHVTMLAEQGIVTKDEADRIIAGLEAIRAGIQSGEITFNVEDEDIHMGIESRLIAMIGGGVTLIIFFGYLGAAALCLLLVAVALPIRLVMGKRAEKTLTKL